MTPEDAAQAPSMKGLHEFQREFATNFLTAATPHVRLLISPVGLGKTTTAVAIATALLQYSPNARIAYLGDQSAGKAISYRARSASGSAQVDVVSRSRFRELVAGSDKGSSPWPAGEILFLPLNVLRHTDVAASFADAAWDMLVVDPIPGDVSDLKGALHSLARSQRTYRLLLLSGDGRNEYWFDLASQLVPDPPAVSSWGSSAVLADMRNPSRWEFVEYSRSGQEQAFLSRLQFLGALISTPDDGSVPEARSSLETLLLKRAASSIFSIDQTLGRLLARIQDSIGQDEGPTHATVSPSPRSGWLNAIAGGRLVDQDTREEPLTSEAERLSSRHEGGNPSSQTGEVRQEVLGQLPSLATALEHITEDGKLAALQSLVGRIRANSPSPSEPITVISTFESTVDYLSLGLETTSDPIVALSGSDSSETLSNRVAVFQKEGGLLLATRAALRSLARLTCAHVVHFDLPASQADLDATTASFAAPGSRTVVHYILRDRTASLALEAEQLRQLGLER